MLPRSWGYSPFWECENCVVGSLCMMRKMFPYVSMRVDQGHVVGMPLCQLRVFCQSGDPSSVC